MAPRKEQAQLIWKNPTAWKCLVILQEALDIWPSAF
jgi:hypothetical protein